MIENDSQYVDAYPTIAYTTEQADARLSYYTDVSSYLETSVAQFITGEIDVEDDWDSYISSLESMGLEELLAIEQEAYDDYLAILE